MDNDLSGKNESTAIAHVERLVSGWNQASFQVYSQGFTQSLVDHYNPNYFTRIRNQCGQWLSNHYLGCLKQGRHYVHLWSSKFERSADDALFSLTLTEDGKIAGLLKRFSKV
jgi:hypothetical protein